MTKASAGGGVSRSALRYHGGKFRLGPWIIEHLPRHICYCEPYGGAMSVLLRKERSDLEVYNDLDEQVVTFFRVLRERTEELIEAIRLTPYARAEHRASYEPTDDPLERARRLYVRAWQGMGSSLRPSRTGWRYERIRSRRSSLSHQWTQVGHLREIADRMNGVQIECDEALAVIQRYDAPSTAFYVDPPYVHGTRCRDKDYNHELTDAQHAELAAQLHHVQGMVLISGYPSALYEDLYGDWRHADRVARVIDGQERVERLWISPHAERRTRQGRLF